MKVGQGFIVLDSSGEGLSTLHANNIAVKHKLCQELLIHQALRKCGDTVLADADVLKGDDSESVIVNESIGNTGKAFILKRVIIEVDFAKFVLV